MLSAIEIIKIDKASTEILELLDEIQDCESRLTNVTATKKYAVDAHDAELVAESVNLEEQLSGLIETDERIIKLNAQLIEYILN